MNNKEPVVKIGEKLGFMSYSAATNIVYNFRSIYYLIFLTNVLKVPVLTAGTILTIGLIWDGVNDPLIGIWCVNHSFKNGERIRPYIKYAAIPWALFTILLFTSYDFGTTWTAIAALVIYLLYEVANTFKDMPYNAMATLSSGNDADRTSINSFRSLGACLGSGIGAVAITPIVKLFGGLKGENAIIGAADAKPLLLTAVAMGFICIIGSAIHYCTTKERVVEENRSDEKIGFIESIKILLKSRSWVRNMLFIALYGISNSLIMSAINYYAAYVLGSSSAATPILAGYLVASIIVSLLAPKLDRLLGKRKMMFAGIFVLILGKIPFILFPKSIAMMYINSITVGIGATISYVIFNTNRNNISDIIGIECGRRMDSMVSAADNLASRCGSALVTEIMAISLAIAGFDEALLANQPVATVNTIIALVGWVPMLIAIGMLATVWKLDPQEELNEALAAHKTE